MALVGSSLAQRHMGLGSWAGAFPNTGVWFISFLCFLSYLLCLLSAGTSIRPPLPASGWAMLEAGSTSPTFKDTSVLPI